MKFQYFICLALLFSACNKEKISNGPLTPIYKDAIAQLFNSNNNSTWSKLATNCKSLDKLSCLIVKDSGEFKRQLKTPISMSLPLDGKVIFTTVSKNHDQHFAFIFDQEKKSIKPTLTKTHAEFNNDYQLNHFEFSLTQDQPYQLLIFDGNYQVIDKRNFNTTNPIDNQSTKMAVASCMYDEYEKEQKIIWDQLKADKPDLVLFIGDNVYIDSGIYRKLPIPVYQIWKRWFETRNSVEFFYFDNLIPYIAIWDDHDFAKNNGGSENPIKKQAAYALKSFFPNTDHEHFINGPGVSFYLKNENIDLMFFDNRTFRDTKNKDGDHLGADQIEFYVKNSNQRINPVLLIKGDQYFGGYHQYESYELDHPREFQYFLNQINAITRPKILISGDRHLSEIMNIKGLMEITSSPIHSKVFPNSINEEKNPNRLWGMSDEFNYVLMDFYWNQNNYLLEVRDLKNITRFKKQFEIK